MANTPPKKRDYGHTQQSTNQLRPGSLWFWTEIYGKIVCITPESIVRRYIQGNHRLGSKIVHCKSTEVRL